MHMGSLAAMSAICSASRLHVSRCSQVCPASWHCAPSRAAWTTYGCPSMVPCALADVATVTKAPGQAPHVAGHLARTAAASAGKAMVHMCSTPAQSAVVSLHFSGAVAGSTVGSTERSSSSLYMSPSPLPPEPDLATAYSTHRQPS